MQRRAASKKKPSTVHEGVVCPFCALLCDDLRVAVKGDRVELRKPGCEKAEAGFANVISSAEPRVGGKVSDLETAIDRAAAILRAAKQPLIGGLGSDIDGLRAAHRLAEAAGASLDHMHASGMHPSVAVLQSLGWYTTTLSEVRNRADLILIAGADCAAHYARFIETCLEPSRALAPAARRQRRIIYLGPKGIAPSSRKLPIENIYCPANKLAEVLSGLRGAVLGREADEPSIAGVSAKKLSRTAEALRAASYATVVWAPSHFEQQQARFCIETLSRIISDLNQTTRAAGLSLSGDDGGASAMSVSAWLTGHPLGVSYANKSLSADPARIRTARLIKTGELDALLWIDAYGNSKPPKPGADAPLIVVGHPALTTMRSAAVAIPTGLPGIHHDARLTRTDSVITMPLTAVQKSALPSVREVIGAIMDAY